MNVIFLDVDGVLNNDSTKERCNGFIGINERLLKLFLGWLNERDYKIVLSSTWRTAEWSRDELNRCGITWIGMTGRDVTRGNEIKNWLDENPVGRYAILDDLHPGEFLKDQRRFLVQTSYVHGLRQRNLVKIDKILDGSLNKNSGELVI